MTTTSRTETIDAHAKLNLVLAVGPRRADGFHRLVTVMQTIDLADEVTVTISTSAEATGASVVRVHAPGVDGGDTLATRAAQAYMEHVDDARAVDVTITKRIPVGAGLGGGSTDAAAALVALDRLHEGAVPADDLYAMAADIGSDVGFFLAPTRSAVCSGRGELVDPVAPITPRRVLLAWPRIEQSTAAVYAAYTPRRVELPPSAAAFASARNGSWYNDLGGTALALCPPMRAATPRLEDGGLHPLVAGSGSTVFAVVPDDADGDVIAGVRANLEADGCWTHLGTTC